MNTIENNKVINVFMDLKPVEVFGCWSISKDHVSVFGASKEEVFNSFCKSSKYHSDWNWLMQVVEKIESLNFVVDIQNIPGLGQYCRIFSAGADVVTVRNYETKIKAVYNACVEFIKWYNQQNN